MPTSKKRTQKLKNEHNVLVKNPVKTRLGKAIIIILSAGFVLSVVASLVAVLYQLSQQ